jgi:N-acyl-L-homoserine lactone synthetase
MDATTTIETGRSGNDILPGILAGYRFTLCQGPEAAERALEVRRQVYVQGVGYDIPVPDAYDARSWFLLAEDVETGEAVGSMRLTPRFAGSLELEESFSLPKSLRTAKAVELNRFAILPAYRKGKTFLPIVSLGLFKLAFQFLQSVGLWHIIIASKPERLWTYEWLGFSRSGRTASYGNLDGADHELMVCDVRQVAVGFESHPLGDFFLDMAHPEIVLPHVLPELGIGVDAEALGFRQSA